MPRCEWVVQTLTTVPTLIEYQLLKQSTWFDAAFYLDKYRDVAAAHMDPILHYLAHGAHEGRQPHPRFDVEFYREQCKERGIGVASPLLHYLQDGEVLGLAPNRQALHQGWDIDSPPDALFVRRVIAREFDYRFYLDENPDVREAGVDPLQHYLDVGWREGRNPAPHFDSEFYLENYPDIDEAGTNPFFHYLVAGRAEGRLGQPPRDETDIEALNPSDTSADQDAGRAQADPGQGSSDAHELTGESAQAIEHDFVREVLSGEFDAEHYLRQLPHLREHGIDPIDHYLAQGWREGINPHPAFDTAFYLEHHADVREAGVNPFYHFLVAGRTEGRAATRPAAPAAQPPQARDDGPDEFTRKTIASAFDSEFYLDRYPDIASAGVDALEHFLLTGWREGRDPEWGFDTSYYLENNPDVRDAGLNPYFHFLVAGRKEGRKPKDELAVEVGILDKCKPPREAAIHWMRKDLPSPLSAATLARRLSEHAISGAQGTFVAVSHDDYIKVVGGVQNCLTDEERLFNQRSYNYLQIFPTQPLPMFSDEQGGERLLVTVNLNGKPVGTATFATFASVLAKSALAAPRRKASSQRPVLVIHSMLGHSPEAICGLATALQVERTYFWLHDFSSLCESFTLMRNDLSFCHAPPLDSQSCRLCAYGAGRQAHVARVAAMFAKLKPVVISPSQAALDVWRGRSFELSTSDEIVIPHCEIVPSRKKAAAGGPDLSPLRIGYLGYDKYHKGWATFERLAGQFHGEKFDFRHLGRRHGKVPFINFTRVDVTHTDRAAMADAVRRAKLDVVVIWPAWPETYSFVAFEAMSGGALVITHSRSGNVAAAVTALNAGIVVEDEDELVALFNSDTLRKRCLRRRREPAAATRLAYSGCTASLLLKEPTK